MKEVEALWHEMEWMRMELQNTCTDVKQAWAEAQQAHREALQNQGTITAGRNEIKAIDPPIFQARTRN